ncbi:MAG: cobalamin B12-binding domain-containing protein [Chloroflexi bacterium]|nr:cobalamin B12-binding domain-containing protein [Chloroflexota bacterium]
MPQRIVLLTPARRFIANRFGLGYQIPLGLVFIGGPLLEAGHQVRLIDNDLYGWSSERLAAEIAQFKPDCVLLGHTGSTAAHPTCLTTAQELRSALPKVKIAYGGVYPSYAAEATLRECPAIDVVVRGEAEQTVLELAAAWEQGTPLDRVEGITWRDGETIKTNRPRLPIQDLDAYNPGWELVDWPGYKLFGMGRSAGMQFSRGCPLTCTYCGQWLFWKKWRHRSPQNFVGELIRLATAYGVKIVWLADENFAAGHQAVQKVLNLLVQANLGLSLNINMTAADVVRDADILPLYKAAGIDYVVMGIESLEDQVVTSVRKNNPFQVSKQAVQLLRQHNIISLVNIIYGLEDESPTTVKTKLKKLYELDPDILNAVYLTPHFWTAAGRTTQPDNIIQTDQSRWTYRNQVIDTPHLSPSSLFWSVKLTEALFHLRPKALARLFWGGDSRVRRILRSSLAVGFRVVLAEMGEFWFATTFSPQRNLAGWPGRSALPQQNRTLNLKDTGKKIIPPLV